MTGNRNPVAGGYAGQPSDAQRVTAGPRPFGRLRSGFYLPVLVVCGGLWLLLDPGLLP